MKTLNFLAAIALLSMPVITFAITTTTTLNSPSVGPNLISAAHSGETGTTLANPLQSQELSYNTSGPFNFNDTWTLTVHADHVANIEFKPVNLFDFFKINGLTVNSSSPLTFLGLTGTHTFTAAGSTTGSLGGAYSVTTAISAVPVPAAVWLMGTAMLGLVSFAKRKKSA